MATSPAVALVNAIQPVIELLYAHDLAAEKCVGTLVDARGEYVRRCLLMRTRMKNSIAPRPDQLSMAPVQTAEEQEPETNVF